jgi:membrane protease YdiL (CAAX protease family)
MVLPDAAGTAHLHHARELLHAGHGALQVAVTVVFQASALSVCTRRLLSAHRGAPAVMHAAHFVQMVYTSLFGAFACYVFLRTGSLLTVVM